MIDWHQSGEDTLVFDVSIHGRGGRMDTRDELLKLTHAELIQLFLVLEMKSTEFERDLCDAIHMLRVQRR